MLDQGVPAVSGKTQLETQGGLFRDTPLLEIGPGALGLLQTQKVGMIKGARLLVEVVQGFADALLLLLKIRFLPPMRSTRLPLQW